MAQKSEQSAPFTLDQVVREVAQQLASLRANPPAEPVIAFSGCEIELAVSATVSAKGGMQFYIFSAEAGGSAERSSRVLLKFGSTGDPLVMLADAGGRPLAHSEEKK